MKGAVVSTPGYMGREDRAGVEQCVGRFTSRSDIANFQNQLFPYISCMTCRCILQVQRAIDCCSSLNQWDLACALAEEHNMHAENLLNKQAARLLSEGRKIDVIYLYKKARQHGKAASALVELAKKAKARSSLLLMTVVALWYS